jgi:hypothetical protein
MNHGRPGIGVGRINRVLKGAADTAAASPNKWDVRKHVPRMGIGV